MKIINTKTHGVLDYLVGILLIAAPWLLGFYRGGAETWVPVTLGITTLLYSLLTNYELGMLRVIPMPGHLALDALSGLFLAASPWLLGFSDYVYLPHLVVGLLELGVVLLSSAHPYPARNTQARPGTASGAQHRSHV
jgi:hypothetical protein